ncbi:translation initiation factor 2 subunit 3 [Nematocida homosporus]|uniref:translation initiation factor 2 subunit 3 n=1 Tax=Nematocida homosporus TaxID=1912981 RepID=UPI00221E3B3B|nr:translation initiation factor 2 subunit 3 [Nematocida homosporus]KAI5185286.1 translation initiation factor 2 subunit 3 [Nematocida homosporus]
METTSAPQLTTIKGIELSSLNPAIMQNQATINIGMIGHVAHGKSTIVRAISGVKTVRFKSELERNITIKLGYANAKIYQCLGGLCQRPECYLSTASNQKPPKTCRTKNCTGTITLTRHVSFVDCPGHEVLMDTMLTGAAVMDAAILIVAANEPCPQPQTIEHLNAIDVVELERVIVLQNKVDLLTREQALESHDQIKEFIRDSSARNSPIIPTSAQIGCNLDAILDFIVNYIPVPVRDYTTPPTVQVIRSFDINKPGCKPSNYQGGVIGGCLTKGYIAAGDLLEIRPGILEKVDGRLSCRPVTTKVLSLFAESTRLEVAVPGGLVGIGTELDPFFCRGDKLVGQVLGRPGTLPEVYKEMTITYRFFDKLTAESPLLAKPLAVKEQILVNVGSCSSRAQVTIAKEKGAISFILANPICAEVGASVSISRKLRGHWRLIGAGNIRQGRAIPVLDSK